MRILKLVIVSLFFVTLSYAQSKDYADTISNSDLKGVKVKDYVKPQYWDAFTSEIKTLSDINYKILINNISQYKGVDLAKVQEFASSFLSDIYVNDIIINNKNSETDNYKIVNHILNDYDKLKTKDTEIIKCARVYALLSTNDIDGAYNLYYSYIENGCFKEIQFMTILAVTKLFMYGIEDYDIDQSNKVIFYITKILDHVNLSESDKSTYKKVKSRFKDKIRYIIEDEQIDREDQNRRS